MSPFFEKQKLSEGGIFKGREKNVAQKSLNHHRKFSPKAFMASLFILSMGGFFSPSHAVKYAAVVVDTQTGKVLHADQPHVKIPPASLTKMLTAFVLFEELEAKRLSLDSLVKISKNAATQSPSKLGLPAGNTVSVRVAFLALLTRSANDMAVALAEKISGSEAAFVQRMNRTAHRLGMYNSSFKNPSGLPHKHQVTTAADMARLSQALLKRFPSYYRFFSTKSFTYNGQKIHNHNKLLGRYGVDGIKTGFVCASGFNIATSAVQQDRRLIAVVMGGKTAQWRDQRVAYLLGASFSEVFKKKPLDLQEAFESYAEENPDSLSSTDSFSPALNSQDLDIFMEEKPKPFLQEAALSSQEKPFSPKQGPKNWYIQTGAYKNSRDAHMAAALLLEKIPSRCNPVISVSKARLKKSKLYQARLRGFDKHSALKLCKSLKEQKVSCLAGKDSSRSKMLTAMAETG